MRASSISLRYGKMRVSVGCVLLLYIVFLPSPSKAQLAVDYDKYLGNIINNGYDIPRDFDNYWNQVSHENSGKWGSVEATRDVMNWGSLDRIYAYAKSLDFPFWQHCFIWAQQQPAWIAALDSAEQRAEVEEWIAAFGERYPDADFIEVVNEPIESPPNDYPPSYYEALGGKGETGYDWIITAFEMARQYNPTAKLHINAYGVLRGWRNVNTYLTIINLLKDRNLIDGIAEQGHFLEDASIGTITANLNKLADTGLPIYICEYDVNLTDDDEQLAKYQEQFPVFWEHPSVKGITLWGYREGTMWRSESYLVRADGSERPALEWLRDYLENGVSVKHPAISPAVYHLHQNFPNPFNPQTEIVYQIRESGQVKMEIVNLSGQRVRTLVDEVQSPGEYTVQWNAIDDSGNRVPSGVYFYNLRIEGLSRSFAESKKMLLLK